MSWAPNQPRAGYWMVRVIRRGPMVCARIWLCEHEPNEPDNLMDRPYLQGQLGLDLIRPAEIWAMLEFCEGSHETQALLVNPALSDRAPRNGRAPAFKTAPMPQWQQTRARRISLKEYALELEWHRWAARHAPRHPDFHYRRPLDLRTAPPPRFTL